MKLKNIKKIIVFKLAIILIIFQIPVSGYNNNLKYKDSIIKKIKTSNSKKRYSNSYRLSNTLISNFKIKLLSAEECGLLCKTFLKAKQYSQCLNLLKKLKPKQFFTKMPQYKEEINSSFSALSKKLFSLNFDRLPLNKKNELITDKLVNKAVTLCSKNQINKAHDLISKAFILSPLNRNICLKKAQINLFLNKYIQALNSIEAINLRSYKEMLLKSIILYKIHENLQNIITFNELNQYITFIVAKYPNKAEIHYLKGLCLKKIGHLIEAEQEFIKSFSLNNKLKCSIYELIKLNILNKKYDKAFQKISKLLPLNPDSRELHLSMSEILKEIDPAQTKMFHENAAISFLKTTIKPIPDYYKKDNPFSLNPIAYILNDLSNKYCLSQILKLSINNSSYTWTISCLKALFSHGFQLSDKMSAKIETIRTNKEFSFDYLNKKIEDLFNKPELQNFKITGPLYLNKSNIKTKEFSSIITPPGMDNILFIPDSKSSFKRAISIKKPVLIDSMIPSLTNNSASSYTFNKKVLNQEFKASETNYSPKYVYIFKNINNSFLYLAYKNVKLNWKVYYKGKMHNKIEYNIGDKYDSNKVYNIIASNLINPNFFSKPGDEIIVKAELSGEIVVCKVTSINKIFFVNSFKEIKKFFTTAEWLTIYEESL